MALIRCNKCGNLASSRSSACPICGEPIAAQPAAPTTESTTQPVPPVVNTQPTPEVTATRVESTKTEVSTNQPKTLNDILAERSSQNKTVHDTLSGNAGEEAKLEQSSPMGVVTPMPVATPEPQHDDYDYDDNIRSVEEYEADIRRHKRNSLGFMVASGILLILMCGALVWGIMERNDKTAYEETMRKVLGETEAAAEGQLNLLRSNAEDLVGQLEKYKNDNDSMAIRYDEAVKMLAELEKENSYTLDQLRRYQNEVQTLKNIMKQYVRQIDSLNTVNKSLVTENKQYKKEISSANLRANQAEENANELNAKVRQGSVIKVSGIKMFSLNAKSNEVRRIKQAKRLRVDFELTANDLAEPGEKSVYICIYNPDGYLLLSSDMVMFNYEGKDIMASAVRKVDYENNTVPVSIFYDGEAFGKGTYKVEVYIDGRLCGNAEHYFD